MEPKSIVMGETQEPIGWSCSKCGKIRIGASDADFEVVKACCEPLTCMACGGKRKNFTYGQLCRSCYQVQEINEGVKIPIAEYPPDQFVVDLDEANFILAEDIPEVAEEMIADGKAPPFYFYATWFRGIPKLEEAFDEFLDHVDGLFVDVDTWRGADQELVSYQSLLKTIRKWDKKQPKDLGVYYLDRNRFVVWEDD